jgi:hypothetical protein
MRAFLIAMASALGLVVTSLWICTTASAQEPSAWKGPGIASCTQYAQAVRSYGQRNFYFSWAQGFMSGLNTPLLMSGMKGTNLEGRTLEDQLSFVDRYCDQRPLAMYVNAVMSLYDNMRSEQGLHDWRPTPNY